MKAKAIYNNMKARNGKSHMADPLIHPDDRNLINPFSMVQNQLLMSKENAEIKYVYLIINPSDQSKSL